MSPTPDSQAPQFDENTTPAAPSASSNWQRVADAWWAPALVALLFGLTLAWRLPPFSGPDESAHVAYVSALSQGRLPTVPSDSSFDIARGISWQAQHPPLFYALATPLFIMAGRDSLSGLYGMRGLGVLAFVAAVFFVRALGGLLLSPRGTRAATWIVATHPTVAYVCSMANNEALAIALSTSCVWATVKARHSSDRRWLLLAALLGGLGLLTKLTAIAGVLAAAWAAGFERPLVSWAKRAAAIVVGALSMWLPWGLTMRALHGTFVPSPVGTPAFLLSFDILLWPDRLASYLLLSFPDFVGGFIMPFWLMRGLWTFYALDAVALILLILAWRRLKQRPDLQFIAAGFWALYFLILTQILFRDVHTILFSARYTSAITVLAVLLPAADYELRSPRVRTFLATFWFSLPAAITLIVFLFFT